MSETPWTPEEYDRLAGFEGEWRDTWWNRDFVELMAKRWELSNARRALDVGCGAGHWGQMLAPYLSADAEVVGIDLEASFAEKAEARAGKIGLERYSARSGTAESIPFPDASFDVVTCQTVLIHVADVAVATREMLRVLKPGGLLAAVEPNNMACSLVDLSVHPRRPWSEVSELLRFQHVCELGKIALGRGDSSVGDLLPGGFAEAGLVDIQVYTNDRSPALFPPYERAEQRVDLAQWIGWYESDVWPAAGFEEDARTLFLAGDGAPDEFDRLWQMVLGRQRAFIESAGAGTLHGGRGFVTYLVSGRKPNLTAK